MFRLDANTVASYLNFDRLRKIEWQKLDKLLNASAPRLKRYFHPRPPESKSHYLAKSDPKVEWPVIGVALQKDP